MLSSKSQVASGQQPKSLERMLELRYCVSPPYSTQAILGDLTGICRDCSAKQLKKVVQVVMALHHLIQHV